MQSGFLHPLFLLSEELQEGEEKSKLVQEMKPLLGKEGDAPCN